MENEQTSSFTASRFKSLTSAQNLMQYKQGASQIPGPLAQDFTSNTLVDSNSIFQIISDLGNEGYTAKTRYTKKKNNKHKVSEKISNSQSNEQNPMAPGSETTKKVVELSDDNKKNKEHIKKIPTLGQEINNINTNNPNQISFQTKLQEKYERKLQTRNIVEIESAGNSGNQWNSNTLPNQLAQDKFERRIKKKRNKKSSIQMNMNEQNIYFNDDPGSVKGPAGVPRSFLVYQENFAAIEPQREYMSNLPSRHVQTPMYQHAPAFESQMFVPITNANANACQQLYSPTAMYADVKQNDDELEDVSRSPDLLESGQKRLSAFERLGPLAQPKKPKLTINLSLSEDQAVREVLEIKKDVPVYDNGDVINSTDETVVKYLPVWPWKKSVVTKKTVTARSSKTVMMMEQEQMEEVYEKENAYIMISVTGYPPSWTKENVLDTMLENLNGKSFVPFFIEFNSNECKFFVVRCRGALLAIHWLGFRIRAPDAELTVSVSSTLMTIPKMDFSPRLVVKKRLAMGYDGERVLDLSEFTLRHDISHFIYFPLNRTCNQDEIARIHSVVVWEYLTDLNLSRNRITSLNGFNLELLTPKLRTLDLSHNHLDSIKPLLQCRQLPLKRLMLEGNPLCTDYTDPDRYIRVMRIMFPTLRELDNVPIILKGDMPKIQRNYCPVDATAVVEKFLALYFPLLEEPPEDRRNIQALYSDKAVMTITFRSKLRHDPKFKNGRNLLIKSRVLMEGDEDEVCGAAAIVKLLIKWPPLQHDPSTFSVDVMMHTETSTIIQINGVLKLTAATLADDETMLAFTRTVHLHTKNGYEYKIFNEMLYWDEPTQEYSRKAFQLLSVRKKPVMGFKFESTPDNDTKERLIQIFMKITELEKSASERCLEAKGWHIKDAVEYFMKLVKLDNIHCLLK